LANPEIEIRISTCYQRIEEKLLETPITDHRKHTIDLVSSPYSVVIKHLSFEESYSIIKDRIVKCNNVRMLRLLIEYFRGFAGGSATYLFDYLKKATTRREINK
jgi:hypothetical protein